MLFAGEEVLQAVDLELDGAVNEPVLVGAGVVPERVRVPERDVRQVLECAAAVGAGGLRQQPSLRGQAAMEFLHRVDRIAEVFERVISAEHTDFTVARLGRPLLKHRPTCHHKTKADRTFSDGRLCSPDAAFMASSVAPGTCRTTLSDGFPVGTAGR